MSKLIFFEKSHISCDLFAKQMIVMKFQNIFFEKKKCHLQQLLLSFFFFKWSLCK